MDSTTLIGMIAVSAVVGALIAAFAVDHKSKRYIREAMGKGEERDVRVKGQPIEVKEAVTYAEKGDTDRRFHDVHAQINGVRAHFDKKFDEVQGDTDKKLDRMAKDAVDGRRVLHNEVKEVRKEMSEIPEQTINLLLKTKELNK